jgi:hypothetical protein
MHEQHVSQVPSLHSFKTPDDIIVTIQPYERNHKQTLLGLQNIRPQDRTLLGYTADSTSLGRKNMGLANRIFLEAERYD